MESSRDVGYLSSFTVWKQTKCSKKKLSSRWNLDGGGLFSRNFLVCVAWKIFINVSPPKSQRKTQQETFQRALLKVFLGWGKIVTSCSHLNRERFFADCSSSLICSHLFSDLKQATGTLFHRNKFIPEINTPKNQQKWPRFSGIFSFPDGKALFHCVFSNHTFLRFWWELRKTPHFFQGK